MSVQDHAHEVRGWRAAPWTQPIAAPMSHSLHTLLLQQLIHGTDLAHDGYFEALRNREFSRLDKHKQVYLDYTGGGLHSSSQVTRHMEYLLTSVHGNPHSVNPTSMASTEAVEAARQKVLAFFNATEDYHCIFTPNASGALKIVGECYPFQEDGTYLLTADNHNSVNGIREFCANKGGTFQYAPLNENLTLDSAALKQALKSFEGRNKLFAFPAQSNVSGVRHALKWVKRAQKQGWDVLLDAAAFAPTSPLDLTKVPADFVAVSFYKIFGFPTGLGALLVRKSAFEKLQKPWYAGGNITLSSVGGANRFMHDDHQRFEDGTVNYLDIPAISEGLRFVEEVGMGRLKQRVDSLALYLHQGLKGLRHANGTPLIRTYGPADRRSCGGTLAMNFQNPDGAIIPTSAVEDQANERGISLRTGCFCNPGVDEVNHGIASAALEAYFGNRAQGDYYDFIAFSGIRRGAVRVSVGMATNRADLDRFIAFAATFCT